jgi:lipid-binding SYLF domain-containing protein
MKKVIAIVLFGTLLFALGCGHKATTAATPQGIDAQKAELGDRVQMATDDLSALLSAPDSEVPEEILSKAQCVAVIPDMVKGGFVSGGKHGRGLATCRTGNGWSAPVPVALTGGSWGAQIGVQSADVVLLFMNGGSLQSLLNNQVQIGGEASVAAGPVGRHAQAATDAALKAQILSYSRTKGLFAGLDLGGAKMSQDMDTTAALYGSQIPYSRILSGQVATPQMAQQFVSAVRREFVAARND